MGGEPGDVVDGEAAAVERGASPTPPRCARPGGTPRARPSAGSARPWRASRPSSGGGCPPAGISSSPAAQPSQPRSQASRPGPSSGDALRTIAAAPSPKRMHVPRSRGSVTRESVSAPIDEHVVEVAGGEQRRADDELVDEAGAPGVEVERAAAEPEPVADERAGVGDRLLGGGGGDDEQVDGIGREPGVLDRGRAGFDREAGGGLAVGRRCGAPGSRCARRSTGRTCRPAARVRRW